MRPAIQKRRWLLELEDGTRIETTAVKAPSWVAYSTHEEPQYRLTRHSIPGVGRMKEADHSLPTIEKRDYLAFELRRHAKGACTNEHWFTSGFYAPVFRFAPLNRRHLVRVSNATELDGRAPGLDRAITITRKEVDRADRIWQARTATA